eukprot:6126130-Amphidinium_carterae.1
MPRRKYTPETPRGMRRLCYYDRKAFMHKGACSALVLRAKPGNTMDARNKPNSRSHRLSTFGPESFAAKTSSPKLVAAAETSVTVLFTTHCQNPE